MKRMIITLTVIILFILSGCTPQNISREALSASSESKKEYVKLTYASPPRFLNMGEKEFDVLEMKINGSTPIFKDIGEFSKGNFRLDDVMLRYSNCRPEYFYDEENGINYETGRYICSIPQSFWDNIKNKEGEIVCEGIIVFEKVPFSFYYNEDGEPYVKCLETRFHSYFKEDRSYVDFVNFAINYEPVNYVTEEDLLSR